MERPRTAVHRTIVVVDVAGFGDVRRTTSDQLAVRGGLYRVVRDAFETAGVPWTRCEREDRGDGVFLLVPAEIPMTVFVEDLPAALARGLRDHNSVHKPEQQIRLRMAVHAGEVSYDEYGVTSAAITLAFRLVNAAAVKAALARSTGSLAVIASDWFFDEVIRRNPCLDLAKHRATGISVKETSTVGWISLPDDIRSVA